ncbi:MAG: nicotinate-nucleotide adenylyltransferase [Deltaproteobacteria bacterium]|nr:nicotinate-nucleotide adenylyltransferase [Deltaproteobacteria bacterium]
MKWGLFGGTFDPIHLGHLRCAQEILEICSLDKIVFIPAFQPPHKQGQTITAFHHRKTMLEAAIEGNPRFEVSEAESLRQGFSYSIDTVEHLQAHSGDATLFFITGLDAFADIRTWKNWRELLRQCSFIVMTRPGFETFDLAKILSPEIADMYRFDAASDRFIGPGGGTLLFRRVTFLDISSRAIRNLSAGGMSIRYLVPEAVRRHIDFHNLYGLDHPGKMK